jgi:hypothetical protein
MLWILLQQGEGALVYLACGASGPPIGVLIGAVAILGCGITCAVSWRIARAAARAAERPAQRFLAQVATGASAIFALAAAVMTAAIWLVPSCAR